VVLVLWTCIQCRGGSCPFLEGKKEKEGGPDYEKAKPEKGKLVALVGKRNKKYRSWFRQKEKGNDNFVQQKM